MINSTKWPKKFKASEGFGKCQIHDRWETTMHFIYKDEYYNLCAWAFEDMSP